MDGIGSKSVALVRRSARIATTVAVVIAISFVALLLVERSGPSPVHGLGRISTSHPATTTTHTTVHSTTTTINHECHDKDDKTGEGPKDEDPDGECEPSGT